MSSCTDYYTSRRRFLAQTAGVGALLGMPINRLVAAIGSAHAPKAESVVLFWNGGGMSHIDTWDPKPGREVGGEFEPIKTSADGIQISEIFPQLAKQMHHCSIIRSIAGTNGDHGRATYELQTSHPQNPALVHPGLGSFVINESQKAGDLPAYISIGGMAPAPAISASAARPTTSACPASATRISPSPTASTTRKASAASKSSPA